MRLSLVDLPHIEHVELEEAWHADALFACDRLQVIDTDEKGVLDHTCRAVLDLVIVADCWGLRKL